MKNKRNTKNNKLFSILVASLMVVAIPALAGAKPVQAGNKAGLVANPTGDATPTAKVSTPKKKAAPKPPRDYPVTHLEGWTLNKSKSWAQFFPQIEIGFLGVAYHTLRLSRSGTNFDFVGEGGQNNLFFFWRAQARLRLFGRHEITFLYQPIDARTEVTFRRDVTVNDTVFPAGTPMTLRYGFDFYRLSYHWIAVKKPRFTFAFGAGVQLRNATIDFSSADGRLRNTERNIGPVPLLKILSRYRATSRFWLEVEADFFWAGDRVINGSTNKVEGWIVDASLRLGFNVSSYLDVFLNARYLGGGAVGISDDDPNEPGDGYTRNFLSTVIFSLGIAVR